MINILIYCLLGFGLLAHGANIDIAAETMVKLEASDHTKNDDPIKTTYKTVEPSLLIKNFISDHGTENPIKLSEINKKQLNDYVIPVLELIENSQKYDIIKITTTLTVNDFIDFITVMNYLGISSILQYIGDTFKESLMAIDDPAQLENLIINDATRELIKQQLINIPHRYLWSSFSGLCARFEDNEKAISYIENNSISLNTISLTTGQITSNTENTVNEHKSNKSCISKSRNLLYKLSKRYDMIEIFDTKTLLKKKIGLIKTHAASLYLTANDNILLSLNANGFNAWNVKNIDDIKHINSIEISYGEKFLISHNAPKIFTLTPHYKNPNILIYNISEEDIKKHSVELDTLTTKMTLNDDENSLLLYSIDGSRWTINTTTLVHQKNCEAYADAQNISGLQWRCPIAMNHKLTISSSHKPILWSTDGDVIISLDSGNDLIRVLKTYPLNHSGKTNILQQLWLLLKMHNRSETTPYALKKGSLSRRIFNDLPSITKRFFLNNGSVRKI